MGHAINIINNLIINNFNELDGQNSFQVNACMIDLHCCHLRGHYLSKSPISIINFIIMIIIITIVLSAMYHTHSSSQRTKQNIYMSSIIVLFRSLIILVSACFMYAQIMNLSI